MMEWRIGYVTHYYNHLEVAVLELSDELKVGDAIHLVQIISLLTVGKEITCYGRRN
jgi:hypothetical protein